MVGRGWGGGCFEDEKERSRIHACNYIFQTDVIAQLTINRNCEKEDFAAQNLGGAYDPCAPP